MQVSFILNEYLYYTILKIGDMKYLVFVGYVVNTSFMI